MIVIPLVPRRALARMGARFFSRISALFRDIFELPDLSTFRSSVASSASAGKIFFVFRKWSATRAMLEAGFLGVPAKIRLPMDSPRRFFAARSPSAQRRASTMFDLPEPFGPTIPTIFSGRLKSVFCAKDLNP
tara:strand:+ start:3634 stop:4032 length:399 start_codon:yes stop_codon:yes gene_type:complete